MEPSSAAQPRAAGSPAHACLAATPAPPSERDELSSPSQSWRSSAQSSAAGPEGAPGSSMARPRRVGPLALAPAPEPKPLRLRPASLRTQDVSHLLAGVFRGLYSGEVIGEDLSASLIKGRGSENPRHEAFVEQLRQIREIYKQRLGEIEMLERHIIQARARALAEMERAVNQAKVQAHEVPVRLPPVKTAFRWCVDSELLRERHLICPEDYCDQTVPFCSAPRGTVLPGYSRPTFSFEMRSMPKKSLTRKLNAPCRQLLAAPEEELDYTVDSDTWDSTSKARQRARDAVKSTEPLKGTNWANQRRGPQRAAQPPPPGSSRSWDRSRKDFLRNPRFSPPDTPHGGRSLIFPPKKPAPSREPESLRPERSCADTPVFLAKPSVVFFTDYEIGSVYEMVLALQNTTAASRYLRVLPPSTPYFALGLGMFPGEGGMVAPGMTCQYTVQFMPDCLGDFDDFILVETQSAHTLLIPLQARRPPPVLTLSPVLDCGYCLVGGVKMTKFTCRNVGFSTGRFCIVPRKGWPPTSFRAVAAPGFVEQPPFGILPSVFELAPGAITVLEVLFLPTSLGKAEQAFVIVCDNCQLKELVTVGVGQLVALDLIYVSGEKSEPGPGELTDLTAQHFIRFEPENLQATASKQLVIRNATHVELTFHWQVMKPNLQPLLPGEAYSADSIKAHPDRETAFSILPRRGTLCPHTDHEFILEFSPQQLGTFHSVLQMVLEGVPEPTSSEAESLGDGSCPAEDVVVLEVEVKGSAQPFQVLLQPYALLIPGESYIGTNVKKSFKMWNNSTSAIRYTWGKICDCHIIEVEPCAGLIEPSEAEDFELSFTGGVPGPTSQDLLCEIQHSPSPVVLHIEAAFKGPTLVLSVPALQFGLLRLGQKACEDIRIRNVSQLPALWHLRESPGCLEERRPQVSPFQIEPCSGQLQPLGECTVTVTLRATHCQRLQTVLQLEVQNGAWSYLPVYAEVQGPHVYLQSSQVELSNLFLGVPARAIVTLVNGTLLPTRYHWGKLLGQQAEFCSSRICPRCGLLGPREERQLRLELTTQTQEELTQLALPCYVAGMRKPLVLGISGKPQGLQVTMAISTEDSEGSRVFSTQQWPGDLEELHLDFGSAVPLRTRVSRQFILTNCSPIQTPFSLEFEYFGCPHGEPGRKSSVPDVSPALLKTARIQKRLVTREQWDFMESMLAHGKGAAFFPDISQGMLGTYQQLSIDLTGCANMWGEYWDRLICRVGDLPPAIIPVHMAVVGCPVSSLRTTYCTAGLFQEERVIRFGTQISGANTVTRALRLNNSSPCDIRLDWETYVPEDRGDRLLELLVFYGPPFPLQERAGSELACPDTPESRGFSPSPSLSEGSESSHGAALSVAGSSGASMPNIISVVLQGHEGVPCDHLYSVSPKQVVVPAGGSSTVHISFTPTLLGPDVQHRVECTGYALGFMSLDSEVEREVPGRRRRLQDFAVGPLRLELLGHVRPAQLSLELDPSGCVEFRCQASDLIPKQPCAGVLSELVITRHLKLTNTTEIPHHFRLLASRPFSVSQDGAGRGHGAPDPGHEEETVSVSKQLVLRPQENMLVPVSFSLSLELLSYQTLPADQMLPGVDIVRSARGEREMVFSQSLRLDYGTQSAQEVPLRAVVAVPELQLSSSWLDFGTCFVKQRQVREVCLMNLSGCRSYWAVLMGQQEPAKHAGAFEVSPSTGVLEARPHNGPPTSVSLQLLFTARSCELYQCTLVVDGVLGEKACALRLQGLGSHDERYASSLQP
ncbi:deleted in lung and esophageal cancer protein 1 [Lepus europaeus]|uniref:deleted in lung and esophageal cancer protein 1 n=1 Tax=Lepus europaeus TaxID=9983 RepID=UPI002B47A8E0|nr:deleted in lung and esophageal cancer protein 1 [Lepus europaeus]